MTINELFDKYNIRYEMKQQDKGIQLYKVGKINLLIWFNDGNIFKLKRKWFNVLTADGDKYSLLLFDKAAKKYYYLKFNQRNKNKFHVCCLSEKNYSYILIISGTPYFSYCVP